METVIKKVSDNDVTSSDPERQLVYPSKSDVVGNRIAAALIGALAGWATWTSWGYGIFLDGRPGPGLFPFVISVPMVVLSVLWFLTARRPEALAMDDLADPDEPSDPKGRLRVIVTVALSVAAILVLQPLGLVLTLSVYVAGLLYLVSGLRLWTSAIGALVGSALAGYLLDSLGMAIPLPPFPIPFLGG